MLRRTLVGLVAIGVLGSFMGMGGFSLFTATTDNDSNTFTSGGVQISTNPSSAFLTMDNMAPGDSVTAKLTVSNDGSLQMRYAMTTATTNVDTKHLDTALTLVIKELGTNCTLFDGTQLYTGTLAGGFFGDKKVGPDTGDRTLDAHTPEDLCFKVTLPSDAVGPMDAATTATFTFDAEQTTNNP